MRLRSRGASFGSAARSRISRITRVVEQADLNRAKLAAQEEQQPGASQLPEGAVQAASAVPDESDPEPEPASSESDAEERFDALEQRALDRWSAAGSTKSDASSAEQRFGGFVNGEGLFISGAIDPRGWDASQMKSLTLVWDMGAGGCSGWGLEGARMVLSLEPYLGRLGVVAGANSWCDGMPQEDVDRLERLRRMPIEQWGRENLAAPTTATTAAEGEVQAIGADGASSSSALRGIDVWISHKPPPRYPVFPYRGAVTVANPPLFLIGRSMSEVHRVPSTWVTLAQQKVDEVWVPSTSSRVAFEAADMDPKQLRLIPEPVDAALFDAVSTLPMGGAEMDLPLRGFNFLSVFKFEERKGWRALIKAWFEEFSEGDDVTLTLHTYLFGDDAQGSFGGARDPARIRRKIQAFVSTLSFPGRDLSARPLPWANLLIHTREVPTEDMPSFYAAFSAFVLPTRGEGWGMPIMEAMAMGLPAIATNWGGQLEFMTSSSSYLVPVTDFPPASDGSLFSPADTEGARWAEPSVPMLRKVMRHCVTHPEHTVPVGARGREHVLTKFNSQTVAALMLRRLTELYPLIVERRQWVAEGRRLVRGAHLHSSLDSRALPPAQALAAASTPQAAGLLARKGADVFEEAHRAAQQAEQDSLAAALVASQRTAWTPGTKEHTTAEEGRGAGEVTQPLQPESTETVEADGAFVLPAQKLPLDVAAAAVEQEASRADAESVQTEQELQPQVASEKQVLQQQDVAQPLSAAIQGVTPSNSPRAVRPRTPQPAEASVSP